MLHSRREATLRTIFFMPCSSASTSVQSSMPFAFSSSSRRPMMLKSPSHTDWHVSVPPPHVAEQEQYSVHGLWS